jgi:autophagy-related protein 16
VIPRIALPKKILKTFVAHSEPVNDIAFSGSGTIIATSSNDKTIKLWNSDNATLRTTLGGSPKLIMGLCFSPSDEFILGCSSDNAARLWSVQSGRVKHTLTGHTNKVPSGCFIDADQVVTGSHDRMIKVWDLTRGFCSRTISCFSSCNTVKMTNGSFLLLLASSCFVLLRPASSASSFFVLLRPASSCFVFFVLLRPASSCF